MPGFRTEKDSSGEVKIPANALYGPQTQRAIENFSISGIRMPEKLIQAIAIIKYAAARANFELKLLDKDRYLAIRQAAEEIISGEFADSFPVDVYQTGSGTSTNMNVNEVIANRANQIIKLKSGKNINVHPNDHVNLCQSSNDVIPSAIHIAAVEQITELLCSLSFLKISLEKKAKEFDRYVKIGRTHLQDAVPIRLGQEFSGYTTQIKHAIERIKSSLPRMQEIPLGGTAVGTGLNAHPRFSELAINFINKFTGGKFFPAKNRFEAISAKDAILELSGQLKTTAISLMKIANDLRWMSSGPRGGIGEISLPELQPGSSIMPGKVNPVIPESVLMVCATVIGNDAAITVACQHGNFELNTMMPVIAHHLLNSIDLLTRATKIFAQKCIDGIHAHEKRMHEFVEKSLSLVTVLNPILGYDRAAKLAKEAFESGKTIREIVLEKNILTEQQLNEILNFKKMTEPGFLFSKKIDITKD